MSLYYRPLVQSGPHRPGTAAALAGGQSWFCHVAVLARDAAPRVVPVDQMPADALTQLTRPRATVAGLTFEVPRLMGILNVTPDSFSDGGQFDTPETALDQAKEMVRAGADILDIGGESTRPGAETVAVEVEIARTAPVIAAIRAGFGGPISIDTRKSAVAQAAWQAGATVLNDVSALGHDPEMAQVAVAGDLPIVLMHAQGAPDVMQAAPSYDNVVLDVYDALAMRVDRAKAAGIAPERIVIDPGIGFGKTLQHNLTLLSHLSLFHSLGFPILLGASRKRFIGTLAGADNPQDRMPGSLAVALAAVGQGVQILRVHDIAQTKQALTLWRAASTGDRP